MKFAWIRRVMGRAKVAKDARMVRLAISLADDCAQMRVKELFPMALDMGTDEESYFDSQTVFSCCGSEFEEDDQKRADEAVQWLEARGLLKRHATVPEWVQVQYVD